MTVPNVDPSFSFDALISRFAAFGDVKDIDSSASLSGLRVVEFYDTRHAEAAANAVARADASGNSQGGGGGYSDGAVGGVHAQFGGGGGGGQPPHGGMRSVQSAGMLSSGYGGSMRPPMQQPIGMRNVQSHAALVGMGTSTSIPEEGWRPQSWDESLSGHGLASALQNELMAGGKIYTAFLSDALP